MQNRDVRTRAERERDRDFLRRAGITLLAVLVAVALIVLLCGAEPPVEETPTAQERAAAFAAQEAYYEVLDRYGDAEGAVHAAELVYGDRMEEATGQ